jgi:protein-tyrosine phosphatase/arsenate reductase
MYSKIKQYCELSATQFDDISEERKVLLAKIANHIQALQGRNEAINLVYVCTHNSRRSHFGQVWAAVAAAYYGVKNVRTFSGGTEATAFNINAINALKRVGFKVLNDGAISNPRYEVRFAENGVTTCFSKCYDSVENPNTNVIAIMTCGDAEQNCPFIPNVSLRIATTYRDPKAFDKTVLQDHKYSERCLQIATEVLYMFSLLRV